MGHVLNVNFPSKRKCLRCRLAAEEEKRGEDGEGGEEDGPSSPSPSSSSYPPDRMRAIALTTQGGHCWRPGFDERYARVEKNGGDGCSLAIDARLSRSPFSLVLSLSRSACALHLERVDRASSAVDGNASLSLEAPCPQQTSFKERQCRSPT